MKTLHIVLFALLAFIHAPAILADEATFAGGCFWCMEHDFAKVKGVLSTTAGYAGGTLKNPSYKQVTAGNSGHREVVRLVYDPKKISYAALLDIYWLNIDPTDGKGQFCDKGSQYTSAIFYHNDEQRQLAETSKHKLEQSEVLPTAIVTEILPITTFYPAESYHQQYYKVNPIRYKFYRYRCGRDQRLKELWSERKRL